MKKTLLLPLLLTVCSLAIGQQSPTVLSPEQAKAARMEAPSPWGNVKTQVPPAEPVLGFRMLEEEIGITTFETQTVASMGRRVGDFGDGTASAIWHFGLDEAGGYPDRGAGYNHFDGSSWGPNPTTSLEETRSGYPSFAVTPNGMEVVVSHKSTTGTFWTLTAHTKMPTETEWTEHEIPSTTVGGNVWAKVATGGPDGNTIHVLAISLSPGFAGGAIHEGMDAHPLYFRSTDGGATWDVSDFIIPGIDSSFYNRMNSEAYTIEADGETVAIGVFPTFGDIAIAKSTDNGDTWEKTIVKDFPLDKYDEMGYTTNDIPADPNAPDSLYILSTDASGSMVIDDDGKVHVFFGWMYWEHTTDYFLNLGTSGIAYWNEDMATDDIATIADIEDFDGNMEIDIDGGTLGTIRYGNSGLTSFPSAAKDADGNLYVVYQAMREDLLSADNFNYRHLFIIKSEDGGSTWTMPFDIINPDVTEVPEFIEAAYPAIPPVVHGDVIHLTYKQDFVPGLTPTTPPTTVPEQMIMHVMLDKNTLNIVSDAGEVGEVATSMAIFPNPSTGAVQVKFELVQTAEVQLQLVNLLGEQVYFSKNENLPTGQHTQSLDLSALPSGVYFVQLGLGSEQLTRKLVLR